jgi:predicted MFS family arabinose efflux permease
LNSYFNFKTLWFLTTLTLLILIPIIYFILHNQKSRDAALQKNIDNEKTHKRWTITEILKDRVFFIYFPLAASFPFIGTGLMFHQIYIFDAKGWTMEMLGNGYIYFGLFSVLGLLIGGPLIDKINTKKAIPFVLLPLLVCITILFFSNNYWSFVLYMSLFGFNLGLSAPFMGSLWAEIYGVKSIGTAKALLHAVGVFASALSPVVFGYIIDWGYGISVIFLISSIMIVVSSILPIIYKT